MNESADHSRRVKFDQTHDIAEEIWTFSMALFDFKYAMPIGQRNEEDSKVVQ